MALGLSLAVIMTGSAGYILIEGFSPWDALYMTVITISTVGFGEIRPLSPTGRLFTTFLILGGFGVLAFVGHVAVEALAEKIMSPYRERRKMREEIARLQGHYILCGFGRVGASAVEFFLKAGVDFVVIELNEGRCRLLQERRFRFIQGDATNEETLLEAGIKEARGLLALLPSDPHNLFTVLTARELNPTLHIITRAEEPSSEKKLLRAGADKVVSPFTAAGQKIATSMLSATGRPVPASCSPPSGELRPIWVKVLKGSSMEGLTVGQLTRETGRDILGLRKASGRDLLAPAPNIKVERGDLILILNEGKPEEEQEDAALQFHKGQKRVLLVDDNPVILGLYRRLLRRAGFSPLTASNGQEALDLLRRERPEVAVIDYRLPVLSGIEVCRRARSMPELSGIKILLFTGDEDPRTRKRALKAGADGFLRKSPNAHELIEAINGLLQADTGESGDEPDAPQAAAASGESPSGPRDNPLSAEEIQRVLERVDGDLSLLRQIQGLLSSQMGQAATQIQEAIAVQDSASLAEAAHQIKGSMGNLGAQRAFETACLLEELARKKDFRQAGETWQTLQRELDRLEQGLALLVEGRAA